MVKYSKRYHSLGSFGLRLQLKFHILKIAGNELSGHGVGASVDVKAYAKDVIKLRGIINDLYKNSNSKPSLVAPGGFFEPEWYAKLLQVSGSNVVNVVTHHIYNLGAGKLMQCPKNKWINLVACSIIHCYSFRSRH